MAKKGSNPYLKALFLQYSSRYSSIFGSLPPQTIVRWGSRREMQDDNGRKIKAPWGWFYYDDDNIPTILIDDEVRRRKWFKVARETLLHEMTHLSFQGRDKHGRVFKKRMRDLVAKGAFDGLL